MMVNQFRNWWIESPAWQEKQKPSTPHLRRSAATFYESTAVKFKQLFSSFLLLAAVGAFLSRLGLLPPQDTPATFLGQSLPTFQPRAILHYLEKRSRALQGCNPARNIQADGAERAPVGPTRRGCLLVTLGRQRHASKTQPPQLALATRSFSLPIAVGLLSPLGPFHCPSPSVFYAEEFRLSEILRRTRSWRLIR